MTIIFEQHNKAIRYMGHCDFVDNELSKHLDSTNAFEGPEKTLELQFGAGSAVDLNTISVAEWSELLAPVECQILSRISSATPSGGSLDVYLLSESTLVVHGRRMMLKTCGTTSTLKVLRPLLALVRERWGEALGQGQGQSQGVDPLLGSPLARYSRPELKFPERQKDPVHGCWEREVAQLESILGPGEQEERCEAGNTWYCWRSSGSGSSGSGDSKQRLPRKLEIIMHDIAEDAARLFERGSGSGSGCGCGGSGNDDPHVVGAQMLEASGLAAAFPGKRDAFAFAPCGWSANSVCGSRYATVHVTPEQGWSYASYETIVAEEEDEDEGDGDGLCSEGADRCAGVPSELSAAAETVLAVFRPRRYCVVWHC